MIYTIKNEKLTASVNSIGAELISLKSSEQEYIWQGGIWREHAPVLFPACGRINKDTYTYGGKEYKMGIHGFTRRSEFSLVEAADDRLVLELSENPETLASYPFSFKLTAEFTLRDDTLGVSFTVSNTNAEPMPFMFGWHPGFNLWGDAPIESFVLDFGDTNGVTHHLVNDMKFISGAIEAYPLEGGKYTLNEAEIYSQDTLIFSDTTGHVRMSTPKSEREIEVSWSDNLPYLAIWKWATPDARYLCIEPWSGLPGDGVTPEIWEQRLNVTLESGKSETFVYAVKCK